MKRLPKEIREKRRRLWMFFIGGLLLCALIGGFLVILRSVGPVQASDAREEVVMAAHDLVRTFIRPDFRTNFSGAKETLIDVQGTKYYVSGWVDTIADNGQTSRKKYSCFIYRNAVGDWVGDHISVVPQ